MMDESDLLPLSALQHLLFCERQCALIHIEQAWLENRYTAEGRVLHDRVHESDAEQRGEVRIVRGLRMRSLELGLIGQADVVEFRKQATRLHELVASGHTPPATYIAKKCDTCSLMPICQPKTQQQAQAIDDYMKRMVSE